MAHIAVVFYSATGNVAAMARALADGAEAAGAEVRLRRVPELAPPEAIASNPRWAEHVERSAEEPVAALEDLAWADGFAFGTPTRFGAAASQLRQFLDQTGGLWAKGQLADKVGTSFTTASTGHGGLESTLLAMNNLLYHWGSLVLPLGYTAPAVMEQGNPYGASWVSQKGAPPDALALDVCRHQGARLADFAARIRG